MSHASVAKRSREEKESHPERFCRDPKCLWRTVTRVGFKPCPKHTPQPVAWSPDCRECGRPFNNGDMPRSGLCGMCDA